MKIKHDYQGVYVGKDLNLWLLSEGSSGKAVAANRTREIRPSGMRGGLAETWAMGVGLRPIEKFMDMPPNPNAARAVFLPDHLKYKVFVFYFFQLIENFFVTLPRTSIYLVFHWKFILMCYLDCIHSKTFLDILHVMALSLYIHLDYFILEMW